MTNRLTLSDKRDLCAAPCTLAGKPAAITGATLQTAQVIALDGSARFEYSWQTVARLVEMDAPGPARFMWMS